MAILGQSEGTIMLDDASGTPVNISSAVETLTIGYTTQNSKYYTLGLDYGKGVVGKADFNGSIQIYGTDGATEAKQLFEAWATTSAQRRLARTLTVSIPDTTSGSFAYTGEAFLTNVNNMVQLNAASNEPMRHPIELIFDGAVTKSTIAP